MSEVAEAILAAGIPALEAQPEADANIQDTTQATTEAPEAELSEAQPTEAKPEEMFPKKAVNAISRRDKTIGKLREQIAQLKAQTPPKQEVVNGIPKTLPNGEPNPEAYNNYDELTQARIDYKADKRFTENDLKQKEAQVTELETEWQTERKAHLDSDIMAFSKENPGFAALMQQNIEAIKNASPELVNAILEADQPALALNNLALEGKLSQLGNMSLARAAMEIGRAQMQAPIKPKTKAPTPLPASRGSVPAGKEPKDFSPREALAFLTQKD